MILPFALVGLIAGGAWTFRQFQRQKHRRLLQNQLRRSLQGMAHGLKTGMSFLKVLDKTAEDVEDPLRAEWRRVVRALHTGRSLSQTLNELHARVPLKEMGWFVTAAQVTQETGGSLAGVLESLAFTMRERETLREKIAALTAQGKASGFLLSVLPFLMMAALYVVTPQMVKPFFVTALGQTLLAVIIVLVGVGGWFIFRIVSVETE